MPGQLSGFPPCWDEGRAQCHRGSRCQGQGAVLPAQRCPLTEGLGVLSWRSRFRRSYRNTDPSRAPGLHITFVSKGPFSFAQGKKEKEETERVNRLNSQITSLALPLKKGKKKSPFIETISFGYIISLEAGSNFQS